jgi:hypothetical protein
MSFKSFIRRLPFCGEREQHLVMTVHFTGGSTVRLLGVKSVETSKTAAGGFASYKIEWHDGYKPPLVSFALDHITAIIVEKAHGL